MLTPAQVALVQESWKLVVPIADQAAALFYSKLFELDPSLKGLFKSDMKDQGKKLMDMITVAVRGLDDLEGIVPALKSLARRHVGYDVKAEHYDTVGEALLWTLEQGLGPDVFSDACKEAWATTYGIMAQVMIEEAYQTA